MELAKTIGKACGNSAHYAASRAVAISLVEGTPIVARAGASCPANRTRAIGPLRDGRCRSRASLRLSSTGGWVGWVGLLFVVVAAAGIPPSPPPRASANTRVVAWPCSRGCRPRSMRSERRVVGGSISTAASSPRRRPTSTPRPATSIPAGRRWASTSRRSRSPRRHASTSARVALRRMPEAERGEREPGRHRARLADRRQVAVGVDVALRRHPGAVVRLHAPTLVGAQRQPVLGQPLLVRRSGLVEAGYSDPDRRPSSPSEAISPGARGSRTL